MDEMSCFLNFHKEIENIVFLISQRTVWERIEFLIKTADLKRLILTGFIDENKKNEFESRLKNLILEGDIDSEFNMEYISFDKIRHYDSCALCVDDCSGVTVMNAAFLKPEYLLVNMIENNINAFKIWEKYRLFAKYIQIRTLAYGRASRMLVWNKDDANDIELSVIFPTYNVAQYLDKCISSVTQWKAPYVEFLFVNDGSKDNSRDIILKWMEKDSRIKLIDKENGGCASARQLGLDNAKGKYIGFIDPDDFVDERMYKRLLETAMTGSYEIAFCGYNEYYDNTGSTKKVTDVLYDPYCFGTTDPKRILDLVDYCRVAIWRGIYKRELIDRAKIHFYTDLRRFDDLPFKVETFANAKSVVAIPEFLYYYRLSRPGQDVSADDERLYVHFDIFKHLNESIAAKGDKELTDHYQIVKLQTHLYAIKKIKKQFKKYYIKHAKEDLLTTGEVDRTYKLVKERIGSENAELYMKIIGEKFNELY